METTIESFVIVKEEPKQEQEIIHDAKVLYDACDICEYVLPVSEIETPSYSVVKTIIKEDEYFNIQYEL